MRRSTAWSLALLALALTTTGCAELLRILRGGVQTPTAQFQTAELQSIDLDAATVAATFEITNPNPIGLSLAGVDFSFLLDQQKLFDGSAQGGLNLAPSGKSTLVVPVKVPFSSIPNLLTTFATKSEAPYRVEARATVRTPIGDLGLPLRWGGTLPIPKMPKLSLEAAQVRDMNLMGAKIVLTLGVDNPNIFAVPLQALTGHFLVGEQSVATLGLTVPKPLEAGRKTAVELPIDLNFSQVGRALSMTLSSRAAPIKLAGEATLGGKTLPIDLSGTLR